jgi:hypothetical protein
MNLNLIKRNGEKFRWNGVDQSANVIKIVSITEENVEDRSKKRVRIMRRTVKRNEDYKMKYINTIQGVVKQYYDGTRCLSQEFVPQREMPITCLCGAILEIDRTKENYQPTYMVQPRPEGFDFYYIFIREHLSPDIYGPFGSKEERERAINAHGQRYGYDQWEKANVIEIKVSRGSLVQI